MSNETLSPCPFCGGPVQLETVKSRAGTLYGVVCRNTGNRGCTCAMEQVPSRTAEAAIARWNMRQPEVDLRAEVEQLRAQQHQCEPVAWYTEDHLTDLTDKSATTWDCAVADRWRTKGWPVSALYTHADPAEVERLRADIETMRRKNNEYWHETEALRAQLAEAHALLREVRPSCHPKHVAKIDAAISASTERNQCDGCQAGIPLVNGTHRMGKPGGYSDTMSCQAAKYASAGPSESVEIDEWAEFDAWFKDHSKDWPFPSESIKCIARDNDWLVWQARAALERKPSAPNPDAGYAEAFYEVCKLVGIDGAIPASPSAVFKRQVVPAFELLLKDASLHQLLQRAAGEMPEGWVIEVGVERGAGWVSLYNDEGVEMELSGCGHLGEQVAEALEFAAEECGKTGDQAAEASFGDEIPDFTPGKGNKARRRAEEMGIDWKSATSVQVKE